MTEWSPETWTALGTVVIAIFTTILGLFTISVARSTRMTANAADLSARAAIAIDLPLIRICGSIASLSIRISCKPATKLASVGSSMRQPEWVSFVTTQLPLTTRKHKAVIRPQKITFAEMREQGVLGLLIYC
jgi:hypothetical protein